MIQLKICLLGSFAVGKTSLVARFSRGIFSDKYLATLGVKIDRKRLVIDGTTVNLILWDMAGEDEFAKVQMSYLVGASGFLLVFDGTRKLTYDQALMLEKRAQSVVGQLPFVVLANKCDLEEQWEVSAGDIKALTSQKWLVQKTSAKTGEDVDRAFEKLVREILNRQGGSTSIRTGESTGG
jgi:small GTP-binding protein